MRRVQVRLRESYDSSATPKPGEKIAPPKKLAEIDKEKLKGRLSAAIEKARAEDPKELKKKVAELEGQLAKAAAAKPAPPAKAEVKRVEVPVLKDGPIQRLEAVVANLGALQSKAAELADRLVAIEEHVEAAVKSVNQAKAGAVTVAPAAPPRPAAAERLIAVAARPAPPRAAPPGDAGDVSLKAGERKMLAAFVQFGGPAGELSRTQLSIRAGLRGGTFDRYLSTLKGGGFVVNAAGGNLAVTDAGQDYILRAGPVNPPSREQLIAMWKDKLKAGERTMLEVLLAHSHAGVSREQLEQESDYHGGTFDRYLSTLRGAGLAVWDGGVLKPTAELAG
jgi:hypothetical protein